VNRQLFRRAGHAVWVSVAETAWKEVLMKIIVDFDRCEANGVCVGIAPDMFELDDDDNLHVLEGDVADDRVADVEEAVAQCPKAALRLA
jgi:ferredoxin